MAKTPVAITGIGMVSPLGTDRHSTWQALMEGKSGIKAINQFDASHFPTRIAAEVKDCPPVNCRQINKYGVNFTHFAARAADEALEDAGIRPQKSDSDRWGLVAGSGMMTAEFNYWQDFQKRFAKDGRVDLQALGQSAKQYFNAADFGKVQANGGLSLLLQRYQITGYSTSVHTACASGGQALGLALQAIRRGDADTILVGGFDSMINPIGLSSFCLLGALSTDNQQPERASRPFDLTRNGFVLGEGAAFLVIEDWQKAVARGAKIYAELAGEGNSLSAFRITDSHPSGDGPIQAIRAALNDAGERIETVDYINAHGTSTKMNDLGETNAIKAVFGEQALQIPTSSTKSQTGHLIAAAGALECALSAMAIDKQIMPATANLQQADPECNLDYITEGPRQKAIKVALSNSFGFGGSNSSVLLRHPDRTEELR